MNCPECICENAITDFKRYLEQNKSESEMLAIIALNAPNYMRCYKEIKKVLGKSNDKRLAEKFMNIVQKYMPN